jgi:hypothetical protein
LKSLEELSGAHAVHAAHVPTKKLRVLKLVVSHLDPKNAEGRRGFPGRPSDDPLGIEIE